MGSTVQVYGHSWGSCATLRIMVRLISTLCVLIISTQETSIFDHRVTSKVTAGQAVNGVHRARSLGCLRTREAIAISRSTVDEVHRTLGLRVRDRETNASLLPVALTCRDTQ